MFTTDIHEIRVFSVAIPYAGSTYARVLEECHRKRIDYVQFNGALVDVKHAVAHRQFWEEYPRVERLAGEK